jgi:uncharacterized OsmC-like protein
VPTTHGENAWRGPIVESLSPTNIVKTAVWSGGLSFGTTLLAEFGAKERTMEAQEPLKERYRTDAKAALLTLKAKGRADDSTVTCKVETGRGLAVAGIHPKCGGSGLELCSGDLLLEALIACAGVSLKAAASVLDVPVKSATISAEGDVDLRGTLGITEGVPVGFKEIRLHFHVETDAAQSDLAQLLEMTERYCVIFQTIQNSPNTKAHMSVVRN